MRPLKPYFEGEPGVVLGTGPSLAGVDVSGFRVFGINNTYRDFDLDVHTACDPAWWAIYGDEVRSLRITSYTWDREVARQFGVTWIEGRWGDGLSTDPSYIHYGHSSSYQALGLARHYGCDPILLVGFDMAYNGKRHYFEGLSDEPGEYPPALRKWSPFEGLIKCFGSIADQPGLPRIINCTPNSQLKAFEFGHLSDFRG